MSFTAKAFRILIASPSDIPEARDAIENALHSWNRLHADKRGIVLLPWRWETNSVPLLAGYPQQIINEQGVDEADIIVALFGSRLGSPTPDAISGTVEEIERAVATGKPVHLYFSTAPLPHDVDTVQLDGLRTFRTEISSRGLLGEFDSTNQLEQQVWSAIEHDLASLDVTTELDRAIPTGVQFRVDSKTNREFQGTDKNGHAKYTTKHWYEVTNIGGTAAQSVTFESSSTSGLMQLITDERPITLEPGAVWKIPVALSSGVSGMHLIVHWVENDQDESKAFDVQ